MSDMKVLVVGLGSIARKHIRVLKEIAPSLQITVWRQHSREADLGDLQDCVDCVFFEKNEVIQWNPEAVFVTNPAPLHIETALFFAKQGCHLFIEKPLSDKLDDIDLLIQTCAEHNAVLAVGYVLRFLEPLRIIKEALDEGKIGKVLSIDAKIGYDLSKWRAEDYRKSVSARQELGGGVVFELSHELDYVRWLVGEIKEVQAFLGKVSDLEMDVEDIAAITLRFESDAIGSVHLDMVDQVRNRSCRIVGKKGTITLDAVNNQARIFTKDSEKWKDLFKEDNFDYADMYKSQFKNFFQCIREETKPLVTGEDGKKVLEIAIAVKRSAEEGRTVKL